MDFIPKKRRPAMMRKLGRLSREMKHQEAGSNKLTTCLLLRVDKEIVTDLWNVYLNGFVRVGDGPDLDALWRGRLAYKV